ncbi:hypothetical protein GCM10009682_27910 [Luedemannella flava]|uniref:SHOCT domain-containing protein n=2 Tax=Luedemannella flava TaxID=349316 RepID=A0ABN2M0D0_9ACTN
MHSYAPMWPIGGMMVGWLLVTGLIVWAVVTYARPRNDTDNTRVARQILAERYARGEVDTEEYTRRLTTLRSLPTQIELTPVGLNPRLVGPTLGPTDQIRSLTER